MTEKIEFYDYGGGFYDFVFLLPWFILTVQAKRYYVGEDVIFEIEHGEAEHITNIKVKSNNQTIETRIKIFRKWEFKKDGYIARYIEDYLSTNV
jgi:hypothetical protein